MYTDGMKRDEVIAPLQNHRAELQRRGVVHAALFGSVARDEARADSDIDIMIDIDPENQMGVFEFVGLQRYIGGFFDRPVDVVEQAGLKALIRPSVLADAVYAF